MNTFFPTCYAAFLAHVYYLCMLNYFVYVNQHSVIYNKDWSSSFLPSPSPTTNTLSCVLVTLAHPRVVRHVIIAADGWRLCDVSALAQRKMNFVFDVGNKFVLFQQVLLVVLMMVPIRVWLPFCIFSNNL